MTTPHFRKLVWRVKRIEAMALAEARRELEFETSMLAAFDRLRQEKDKAINGPNRRASPKEGEQTQGAQN